MAGLEVRAMTDDRERAERLAQDKIGSELRKIQDQRDAVEAAQREWRTDDVAQLPRGPIALDDERLEALIRRVVREELDRPR
jgi:hypothetical protein